MLLHPLFSPALRGRTSLIDLLQEHPLGALERLEREVWAEPTASVRATRVREGEHGTTLEIDVPGVPPEAIDVRVEGSHVEVAAKAKAHALEGARLVRAERADYTFSQRFRIADSLDAASLSASVKDGVLSLHVSRRAEPAARKIPVVAAEGASHVSS